jgi:hypothetical protein
MNGLGKTKAITDLNALRHNRFHFLFGDPNIILVVRVKPPLIGDIRGLTEIPTPEVKHQSAIREVPLKPWVPFHCVNVSRILLRCSRRPVLERLCHHLQQLIWIRCVPSSKELSIDTRNILTPGEFLLVRLWKQPPVLPRTSNCIGPARISYGTIRPQDPPDAGGHSCARMQAQSVC